MTKPELPKGWKDVSDENVTAFCRPGYESVLSAAWKLKKPKTLVKGSDEHYRRHKLGIIHENTSLAKTELAGALAGLRIHSAARIDNVDIDLVEKARKAGVRVEKPLGVIYPAEGNPIQVLKQIRGKPLTVFLRMEKSPQKRKGVITDLFLQLEKLHKNGMVHGDSHGKNFMVSTSGKVHVIDLNRRERTYEPVDDIFNLKLSIEKLLKESEWPLDGPTGLSRKKAENGGKAR